MKNISTIILSITIIASTMAAAGAQDPSTPPAKKGGIGHGVKTVFKDLGKGTKKVGSDIDKGAKDVVKGTEKGAEVVGADTKKGVSKLTPHKKATTSTAPTASPAVPSTK